MTHQPRMLAWARACEGFELLESHLTTFPYCCNGASFTALTGKGLNRTHIKLHAGVRMGEDLLDSLSRLHRDR